MPAAEALIQAALIGEAIEGGPALVFVADEEMRYIAVNQYACDALGYTREELLALQVTDVARDSGTPEDYDELFARGVRSGSTMLTRKDGSTALLTYRSTRTTVAGLAFFVAVGFLVDE